MIKMEDCEHGRLYRVHMRNGSLGVWDQEAKGFIFIRTKFSARYLFTELHHDADPHYGTATPIEALEDRVPEGIRVDEHTTDSPTIYGVRLRGSKPQEWCAQLCDVVSAMPVEASVGVVEIETKPDPKNPGKHARFIKGTNTEIPWEVETGMRENSDLFKWFETMEAKYRE